MTDTKQKQPFAQFGLFIITILTLTGCYVEVSPDYGYTTDTDVHYRQSIIDYDTQLLADAALIPLNLMMKSPAMVIDPDAYTTPRARLAQRALITDITYGYLFDDSECSAGGYSQTTAEADTTTYNDGYTYVTVDLRAEAFQCAVRSGGRLHTVNSDVQYQVTGWYDDWEYQLDAIDANLTGQVAIHFNLKNISHSGLYTSISSNNSIDFTLRGRSQVSLDDGFTFKSAAWQVERDVHYLANASHPYQGQVRFSNGFDWVELEFENNGLWRTDSDGWERFYRWSELGFY